MEVSPYPSVVFAELSEKLFGGMPFGEVGERATLPPRAGLEARPAPKPAAAAESSAVPEPWLRLAAYRPLFSGPAVERVPELQFQRPAAEIELSARDARAREIGSGDEVIVRSNGTSVTLRARIARDLAAGTVRIAREHAEGLRTHVEVTSA